MATSRPIILFTICYNAEKTLRRTIESVLDNVKEDPNATYIIQDGASTDGSLALAKEYAHHGILIYSEQDKGAYDAINNSIQSVTDEEALIGFIHADDILTPNSLKRIRALLKESPQADIVSMGCAVQSETGEILSQYTGELLKPTISNMFDVSALPNARLISKRLYTQVGLNRWQRPPSAYFTGADVDHMVRCILTRPCMVQDNTIGYIYLTHPDSTTLNLHPDTAVKAHQEHMILLTEYLSPSQSLPFTFREKLSLRCAAVRISLKQAWGQRSISPFIKGMHLGGWLYSPLIATGLALFTIRKLTRRAFCQHQQAVAP